jgi:hypothetical protein
MYDRQYFIDKIERFSQLGMFDDNGELIEWIASEEEYEALVSFIEQEGLDDLYGVLIKNIEQS